MVNKYISMEPEPDYLVCVKANYGILCLEICWSMDAAKKEIKHRQKLNPTIEYFIVKETKKRKLWKTK